jgi:hypothetical protein
MRRSVRLLPVTLLAAFVLILGGALGATHSAKAFDPTKAPEIQDRLLDGLADFELTPSGDAKSSKPLGNFVAKQNDGCGIHDANNIKVNQNCLNISDTTLQGRGQAQNETSIAINPQDKSQIVASYNDYRRGDGTCGSSFSGNGGQSWSDSTVPNGFTSGAKYGGAARQYWQAGGDTSVAFDTKGNAYMACQMFMRGAPVTSNPDLSSAFFVFRSTGNGGASWNFPGRPVAESPAVGGTDQPFLDKEYLTVDDHVGSPHQDRVYVTWTTFAVDGTAYIYEAYSSDYGETFSAPVLVSHDSTALCGNNYGLPTPNGNCNENQFSDPFTGPDGSLYVAWANFNNKVTGSDNRNQILLAKSTDGGVTFGAPVKVGDYYDLPDCDTYQGPGSDPGRACVPEKASTSYSVFRATNLPSGAVNPTNPAQVVVNYGSYINKYSNESQAQKCIPAGFAADGNNKFTGVKTPGACNNKILISVSSNGGTSFTGGASTADPRTQSTVNTSQQAGTDQWWQWTAFSNDGRLAVSYYDRSYGDDETTGNMDFSISGSKDMSTFGTARVTSSSMPPPTEFSGQFFGDYTGLDVSDQAHPLWMDTRDPDLSLCPGTGTEGNPPQTCQGSEPNGLTANDEDIFTAGVAIPTGGGSSGH